MTLRVIAGAALIGAAAVVHMPAQAGSTPVRIGFSAVVGDKAFACSQKFSGIGTSRSTITVSDFRFFVSGVALVDKGGKVVPVALTQDGKWQTGSVGLIDFEDGTGACSNGTPDTRSVIEGSVSAGDYVGLRFNLGLPFDVNHKDPTRAPSPLNLSRLFWNWNGGYKFARIDMKTTGQAQGWVFHLGSTNCKPDNGPSSVPTRCDNENRPMIALTPFNVATQAVQFDLAALLSTSNVDANAKDTPAGCMSTDDDADCKPLFAALGLRFGGAPAGAQTTFRAVERK